MSYDSCNVADFSSAVSGDIKELPKDLGIEVEESLENEVAVCDVSQGRHNAGLSSHKLCLSPKNRRAPWTPASADSWEERSSSIAATCLGGCFLKRQTDAKWSGLLHFVQVFPNARHSLDLTCLLPSPCC